MDTNDLASNCDGWDCEINTQRCLAVTKDAYKYNYTCVNNRWMREIGIWSTDDPASNCEGWNCKINTQRCIAGTKGSQDVNWTCVNHKWKYLDL